MFTIPAMLGGRLDEFITSLLHLESMITIPAIIGGVSGIVVFFCSLGSPNVLSGFSYQTGC